jgi:hypothetical protein
MMPNYDPHAERRLYFKQLADAFRNVVARHAQKRLVPGLIPEPASSDSIIPGEVVVLNHVLWLCDEVDRLIRLDLYGEAVEHIGTIRGVLWTTGVMSLSESKALTKACATCGKPGHRPQDHAGWNPDEEGHG